MANETTRLPGPPDEALILEAIRETHERWKELAGNERRRALLALAGIYGVLSHD